MYCFKTTSDLEVCSSFGRAKSRRGDDHLRDSQNDSSEEQSKRAVLIPKSDAFLTMVFHSSEINEIAAIPDTNGTTRTSHAESFVSSTTSKKCDSDVRCLVVSTTCSFPNSW